MTNDTLGSCETDLDNTDTLEIFLSGRLCIVLIVYYRCTSENSFDRTTKPFVTFFNYTV